MKPFSSSACRVNAAGGCQVAAWSWSDAVTAPSRAKCCSAIGVSVVSRSTWASTRPVAQRARPAKRRSPVPGIVTDAYSCPSWVRKGAWTAMPESASARTQARSEISSSSV
jgi:hypothetical protein